MKFGDSDTALPEIPLASAFVRGLGNVENGKSDTVTDVSIAWRTQSRRSKDRQLWRQQLAGEKAVV
jgi:hypothetical protein